MKTANIIFDYGATKIPIFANTKQELIKSIVDAMRNDGQLQNLDRFMAPDQVGIFQQIFDRARKLPPSKYDCQVWVDYGQEDYEGPVRVNVISKEALENHGTPYVLCLFDADD